MKALYTYTTAIIILLFNLNLNANNPTIPSGVVYQLSVKSSDITKSRKVIEEYHYLRKVMTKGNFYYQFGKYNHYTIADSVKTLLETAGCNNVEVLAYHNHTLIPLAEAISLQYKDEMIPKNNRTKKVAKTITTQEVNYLIQVQKSGLEHYYSLAIPVSSIETVDKILEEIDNEQVIEISLDENLYSIGKYTSFEEVITARKQFIDNEIFDVFIMAQITDDRLENDDASNLALSIQNVVNELAAK